MAEQEPSGFSPEHIANFHRVQQIRRDILRKMGNVLQVWRDCDDKACRRGRSCRRSDAACLYAFMQALPEQDRRLTRHIVENGRNGLAPEAALAQARARVAEENARFED